MDGLKVSHDLSQLEDGESHILTLKDSRILDNEGIIPPVPHTFSSSSFVSLDDELQNVEMAEAEKTKERNELKIKRRDYTGYDDEEFVEGREGMRRAVLSKYDELLEGPKETVSAGSSLFSHLIYSKSKGFRLGASLSSYVPSAQSEEQGTVSVNKALLSIDYTSMWSHQSLHVRRIDSPFSENIESSDYLQKGDVGFKKPKVRFSSSYTFTSDSVPLIRPRKSAQPEGLLKTLTSCPLVTRWKLI